MQYRGPRRPGPRRRPQNRQRPSDQSGTSAAAAVAALPTTPVDIPPTLTVKEFSEKLNTSVSTVIRELLQNGVIASINQTIDFDTAAIVAADLGVEVVEMTFETAQAADQGEDREEDLVTRPPVVTVMGHVDHGKTSLLDAIRKTRVAAGEAGGITQQIGAYQVEAKGQLITFLDTPGHEALTAMLARGANATDIAVLVVAADDGVMPQTREAADHARAAGVPIVVALNKMDRPDANPDRVEQQLMEIGLVGRRFGGENEVIPVSARTGEGIDALLETILLLAEIGNYRANPHRHAVGTVIEAKLDRARGPVATVLVQNGTLKVGDVIAVGRTAGRIKALFNDKGKRIREGQPGAPAEVLGLDSVPDVGVRFQVVADERTARNMAQAGRRAADAKGMGREAATMDSLMEEIRTGALKDLNLIVKADVRGSIEAITGSIQAIADREAIQREVRTKIVHADTGPVTESDVMLAAATHGLIIAFNVRIDAGPRRAAETQGVEIRPYAVIYHMTEDIERLLSGMLEPEYREVIQGEVEIRQVFKIGRTHAAAGCYVTSGSITRNSQVRVFRSGAKLFEGRMESLRRFKDDVRDVQTGYECGITLVGFADFEVGDVIQAFTKEAVPQ